VNIAVFTPTMRPGGLDVLEGTLARQTVRPQMWIVCDERNRSQVLGDISDRVDVPLVEMIPPEKQTGNMRNLAAAYNEAAEIALEWGMDVFVSLQDYIWAPPDGLERFAHVHSNVEQKALVTGLTSIAAEPSVVHDLEGDYTIFAEPYFDKPTDIEWWDVREDQIYHRPDSGNPVGRVMPDHWEANWASIDMRLIDEGIRWDESYDKGVAYENMDFARRADAYGAYVLMDMDNHAISLPHKDYFEGEREAIERYSNRAYYESKWLAK
jgi:hypothetical protein